MSLSSSTSTYKRIGVVLFALTLTFVLLIISRPTQIVFQDSDAFYETLSAQLVAGEQVRVKMPYAPYPELPRKLRSVFSPQTRELQSQKIPLQLNASKLVSLYRKTIVDGVIIGAVTGTAIGFMVGQPVPGAIYGVGTGAFAGLVSGALIDAIDFNRYEVSFLTYDGVYSRFSVIYLNPTI